MKKTKLFGILICVLCVSVMAVGVFAITSTKNTISGTISIVSTNAPVQIQMTVSGINGGNVVTDPVTVRAGTTFNVGDIAFNTEKANTIYDVEDIVISFKITNLAEAKNNQELSSKALGAFFAYEDTVIPDEELAKAEHVAITDKITNGQTDSNLVTYADIYMTSYSPVLPTKVGEEATPTEMKIILTMKSFEQITKWPINYQLFIEPYEAGTTDDGLVKLPIVKAVEAEPTSAVKPLSATALDETSEPEIITEITKDFMLAYSSTVYVAIPYTVTEIGRDAFCNCSNLVTANIPSKVQSIGYNAFSFLYKIKFIDLSSCVLLDTIAAGLFSWGSIQFVKIPSTIKTIEGNAFADCRIKRLDLPQGLDTISSGAFYLSDITYINIPSTVTTIDGAFDHTYISSINIPDGVTSIGMGTFDSCVNLTSIVIPDGVTEIGQMAFNYCKNLTSITIPDSVTEIGTHAFYECEKLTSINLPSNITNLPRSLFYGCINLTSVIIPNAVISIDPAVFYGCSRLTKIIIPNNVTSIGDDAFKNCAELTSITIPKSVTSLNSDVFSGCNSLQTITVLEGSATTFTCKLPGDYTLNKTTACTSLTQIERRVGGNNIYVKK